MVMTLPLPLPLLLLLLALLALLPPAVVLLVLPAEGVLLGGAPLPWLLPPLELVEARGSSLLSIPSPCPCCC